MREQPSAERREDHCTHPDQTWCDCDWCRIHDHWRATTVTFTSLRLRNRHQEDGGAWFTDTVTADHYKTLRAYREVEPFADWHLETRGISTSWHRYDPPMSETCRPTAGR